jgi:protease-4
MRFPWSAPKRAVFIFEISDSINEPLAERFIYRLREMASGSVLPTAVILRINSQGGSLGAAESFVEGVAQLRKEFQMPVVALVTEQALSAAFFVALAADHLIVAPSALVGSVGAVFQSYSFGALAQRIGIVPTVISAGLHKASFHPCGLGGQRQVSEAVSAAVSDTQRNFLGWIQQRRPGAAVAELADELSGLMTGNRAKSLGICDQTGGLLAALQWAAQRNGANSVDIVRINLGAASLHAGVLQRLVIYFFKKFFGKQ